MTQRDELKTEIAAFVDRVLLTEAWESNGEEVAARIMEMLTERGWSSRIQSAPRVFFPGDTVPAGPRFIREDGEVVGSVIDNYVARNVLVEVPSPEEWQAAVDRAHRARLAEATAQPHLDR